MQPPLQDRPLVLTLDVGTSSARCGVFDGTGARILEASTQQKYVPRLSVDGGAELDPGVLFDIVVRLIDGSLARIASLHSQIIGVGTATFWHSLLGIDAAGEAMTPVYLWADARSHSASAILRERLHERQVHGRTGCVLHWSYLPSKLVWLRRGDPARFARVARWVTFGDYLMHRLFGVTLTSVSLASASGLFGQHRCDWDDEVLEAVGIPRSALSPIAAEGEYFTALLPEWRTRWPALARIPWIPPLGDGALSNVGAGCTTPERAALMIGTSVALRVLFRTREFAIPWGVFGYRLDRHRVCLGGALNDGGSLLDWMRRMLILPPREELERQLASMKPDAHGLTLLPLWGGERSPNWAGRARGAILGLSLATTPVELYRAAMEGIAVRCAELDSLLREAVPTLQATIATGGALMHSPAWLSIMADALGRPITASSEREGSSRGAALYVLEQLGLLPGGIEAIPAPEGERHEPVLERHAVYSAVRERQRKLYVDSNAGTPEGET